MTSIRTICKTGIGVLNKVYLAAAAGNCSLQGTSVFRVRAGVADGNDVRFEGCRMTVTHCVVGGTGNRVIAHNAEIDETSITIHGEHNVLRIEEGVKLRKAEVIIRGMGNIVSIGRETTFGGIRIVNVGNRNEVVIGESCLFADHIELWASDTHAIFDAGGKFLNPERPVRIGNKVWVCSHVKILKGVTIGDGAVIGMNTMVTKNIAPRILVAGNPLRCLKKKISWTLGYDNR